jgi:hypothetical protein
MKGRVVKRREMKSREGKSKADVNEVRKVQRIEK